LSKKKKEDVLVPSPVNPEIHEKEARLVREANEAFDHEQSALTEEPEYNDIMPGVPMDEELDADKVEEYCEREPWMLTPLRKSATKGKYGVIPSRFLYLAEKADESGNREDYLKFSRAADKASDIYYEQMKKNFRELQASMSRREIGMFAQTLWTSTTLKVENEGSPISRFIAREKLDLMDDRMTELARDRVYMNSRWLAMVINEIPLERSRGGPQITVH
jgi:hypothetical protein